MRIAGSIRLIDVLQAAEMRERLWMRISGFIGSIDFLEADMACTSLALSDHFISEVVQGCLCRWCKDTYACIDFLEAVVMVQSCLVQTTGFMDFFGLEASVMKQRCHRSHRLDGCSA